MKLRVAVSVITLGVLSSPVLLAESQVATNAGGTNAPAAPLTFSPGLVTGVHSLQEVQGKDSHYVVGPFVRPKFTLGYKQPDLEVNFEYEPTIMSNRGIGDMSDKTFSGNSSIEHHGTLALEGGSAQWKFSGLMDIDYISNTASARLMQNQNQGDILIYAGVNYLPNPKTTIMAFSAYDRTSYFDNANLAKATIDSINQRAQNINDRDAATQKDEISGAKTASTLANVGQTPTKTLYGGAVGIRQEFTDSLAVMSYVRAGKLTANYQGGDGYHYRFHTQVEFDTPIKLSGMLRYRMNITDVTAADIQYQNYILAKLAFKLSKQWSLIGENEFAATKDTTGAGSPGAVDFSNEDYVGVSYSF